ncbi:very short patch repair endonuclease [Cellulomonas persica]|jgi:DNA mismatch endonuclease (patch repair protein)|uniref:Very short patch repair endonuclease n=2 Tax=Cellulomonas persica TaxID=76861 RepID=A0A510URT1_9CELL|nr:very short patch repair endonuclease [Cellulomonas persica]
MRYSVAVRPIPTLRRTADMVFPRARVAVFVDGCYWHGCPVHFKAPASHTEYWGPKIERNRARDAETTRVLRDAGWTVLRFWEHDDAATCAIAIRATVQDCTGARRATGQK